VEVHRPSNHLHVWYQVAELYGADPGRGFDIRVAAPFNRSIAEALQTVGRECVEACPTGALALQQPAPP
jgi:hypothetical protein